MYTFLQVSRIIFTKKKEKNRKKWHMYSLWEDIKRHLKNEKNIYVEDIRKIAV